MAFSTHDIVPDSPTNNFGTWNPLKKYEGSPVYSNGNLLAEDTVNDSDNVPVTCNFPRTGGRKWYTEFYFYDAFEHTNVSSGSMIFLVASDKTNSSLGVYGYAKEYIAGDGSTTNFQYRSTQNTMPYFDYGWGSNISQNYGIIGILIDYESNSIQFSANGQWGTAIFPMDSNAVISGINLSGKYNLENESLYVIVSHGGSDRFKVAMNCGQDPTFGGAKSPTTTYTDANGIGAFYYQPPTDALALCTANLPDFTPDVADDTPQNYFKAVTYTGDGVDLPNGGQQITTGMQPDLVWIKQRNGTDQHCVFDSVRGPGMLLGTNTTSGDSGWQTHVDNGNYYFLHEFNSTGFKVNSSAGNSTNGSGSTFVSWSWKAGGAPDLTSSPTKPFAKNGVQYETLSAANITAGTITPAAMSVNTNAGCSIVKYNGNSGGGDVPHGLSQKPDMLIVRPLTTTSDWIVWHKDIEQLSFNYLYLSQTIGGGFVSNYWGSTGVTNTKFGLYAGHTSAGNNNTNAGTSPYPHIAYCWHSVEGYSKFGSYTGNGSADGPFVYCGFRPAFVMLKNTNNSGAWWQIIDAQRSPYNVVDDYLHPNDAAAESSSPGDSFDFLSNGFKPRGTGSGANGSGNNIIYMAFAEQPFKFSNAR